MNINTDYDYRIRLALLGDSLVGKTSMIIRFIDNIFSPNIRETVGINCRSKIISLGEKRVKVLVSDTSEQERYISIYKSFFQKLDRVMIVYDITNLESFKRARMWIDMARDYNDKNPKIIVGNKTDKEENRKVSKEEGENLAKENNVQFFETSALNGDNIEKVFLFFSEKVSNYLENENNLSNNNFTLEKSKKRKNITC